MHVCKMTWEYRGLFFITLSPEKILNKVDKWAVKELRYFMAVGTLKNLQRSHTQYMQDFVTYVNSTCN